MIRRISTKLLLAVLSAVVVPFLGFAVFVDWQMAARLSRDVVLESLQGLATDLALQLDGELEEHELDLRLAADHRVAQYAIEELAADEVAAETSLRTLQGEAFNSLIAAKPEYDLLLLLDARGRFVVSNTLEPGGEVGSEASWRALAERDWSREPWFQEALAGNTVWLDQAPVRYVEARRAGDGLRPDDFQIGCATPVRSADLDRQRIGVLFASINWRHVQDQLRQPVLKRYFQGLVGEDGRPSAYAWLWKSDGETILAHENVALYGKSVVRDVRLPQMTEAIRAARAQGLTGGLYPEYEFNEKTKNAAWQMCRGIDDGGLGWFVGVGIDNDDIYQGANELRATLIQATAIVVLVAVLLTMIIARRTTAPILALQEHTRRVADGDLEARVEVASQDELGALATAFNAMTAELAQKRALLVKVEKDRAWRDMARQVAHDIKNPLTPMRLSLDLLRRARQERHPDLEAILERTTETISLQIDHLRDISADFHALTGASQIKLETVAIETLIDEVLELHRAWALQSNVRVTRLGSGARVRVDIALMRRVLNNLVSNAMQAMPDGGELTVRVETDADKVRVEFLDTGVGLSAEALAHLFEPHFTTRSTGTGLGLAIARRVIEELGGSIALLPREPGPGTLARIELPRANEA